MPESDVALAIHELQEPGRIERVEQGNGRVRFKDLMLLSPGIWTDAASRQAIYYGPKGIKSAAENITENRVNFLHEREDETWMVGEFDPDTVYVDDKGRLFADVIIDTTKAAGQLADEALTKALETNGTQGIEGPSVEIRGLDYEWNEDKGAKEIIEAELNGLALVGVGISPGPASETASFAHQTRERAVALAEGDGPTPRILRLNMSDRAPDGETVPGTDEPTMPDEAHKLANRLLADMDKREVADIVADTWDGLSVDDVLEILDDAQEAIAPDEAEPEEAPDDEGEADMGEDEDEEDEADLEQDEDEEDEPPEATMATELRELIQALREDLEQRLADLEAQLADLDDQAATTEALSDVDQRLAKLENEPKDPKSLADHNGDKPMDLNLAESLGGDRDPHRQVKVSRR